MRLASFELAGEFLWEGVYSNATHWTPEASAGGPSLSTLWRGGEDPAHQIFEPQLIFISQPCRLCMLHEVLCGVQLALFIERLHQVIRPQLIAFTSSPNQERQSTLHSALAAGEIKLEALIALSIDIRCRIVRAHPITTSRHSFQAGCTTYSIWNSVHDWCPRFES